MNDYVRKTAFFVLFAVALIGSAKGTQAETLPVNKISDLGSLGFLGEKVRGGSVHRSGMVVKITSPSAFPKTQPTPSMKHVKAMINHIVQTLTKEKTAVDAWSHFAGKGDRVGILIDAFGSPNLRVKKEIVKAIILGLKSTGVRDNDIVIWASNSQDLARMGYMLNWTKRGIRVVGADQTGFDHQRTFRLPKMFHRFQLSKIVTQFCHTVINVTSLEDDPVIGFKGSLAQIATSAFSNGHHLARIWQGRGIELLNAQKIVRRKFRLHFIDALTATYNREVVRWRPGVLMGATDPVALDQVSFSMLDNKRAGSGLRRIKNSKNNPYYIQNAGFNGIGKANPNQISLLTYRIP